MADAPAWAEEARTAATAALDAMPELTGTEEEWRFTAPGDIGMAGGESAGGTASGDVALPDPSGRAARLVFVDGAPAPAEVQQLPDGVIVSELGEALREHGDLVREHLYTLADFADRPCALNAARWDAGTFVYVPRGVHLEMPVEAALTATGAAGRVFGRTLIIVEEGAKATVVDEQVFYMMSRGIPELEAKHQIVYGFFQEVLDQISFVELREELERAARAKVR